MKKARLTDDTSNQSSRASSVEHPTPSSQDLPEDSPETDEQELSEYF
jgi:hypothetical protein